jgi:hypothetical protein
MKSNLASIFTLALVCCGVVGSVTPANADTLTFFDVLGTWSVTLAADTPVADLNINGSDLGGLPHFQRLLMTVRRVAVKSQTPGPSSAVIEKASLGFQRLSCLAKLLKNQKLSEHTGIPY